MSSGRIDVHPVTETERTWALRMLLPNLTVAARGELVVEWQQRMRTQGLPGLFVSHDRGRATGAVWAQVQPGRTAVLWPPALSDETDTLAASGLMDTACRYLESQHLSLAQSALRGHTDPQASFMREAGFEPLVDLAYLVAVRDVFPAKPTSTRLCFEAYRPAIHQRFASIVVRTYRDTLDCPRLNGVRRIDDILEGYRATGEFSPHYWLLVRHASQDVGCLLLADFPRTDHMELVYMGVVAEARGNQYGVEIARHALALARKAGRGQMVLAVDQHNTPAMATYEAVGFRAWEQRAIYIRFFHSDR